MYRTIDCGIWDDPWISELDPISKLLFLYLLTNRRATACGVFEITLRAIAFETGLSSEQISDSLAALSPKVLFWEDLQTLWVRTFYRHQRANSNEKFAHAARTALLKFDPCVQAAVHEEYPELQPPQTDPSDQAGTGLHPVPMPMPIPMPLVSNTYPIPVPPPSVGGKETVTVTVTGSGTGSETETKTKQGEGEGRDGTLRARAPARASPSGLNDETAWWQERLQLRADREGLDLAQLTAQIDVEGETERWLNLPPDKQGVWRNWMLRALDFAVRDLRAAQEKGGQVERAKAMGSGGHRPAAGRAGSENSPKARGAPDANGASGPTGAAAVIAAIRAANPASNRAVRGGDDPDMLSDVQRDRLDKPPE